MFTELKAGTNHRSSKGGRSPHQSGGQISAKIFKTMNDEEIEELTTEISRLPNVAADTTGDILEEFHQMALAQEYIAQGGLSYASEVLERALSTTRREILERLKGQLQPAAFEIVKKVDPKNLLDFIRREHPQTIALILANMDPKRAARFSRSWRPTCNRTSSCGSPRWIRRTRRSSSRSRPSWRIGCRRSPREVDLGGREVVAEIMNRLDRSTERSLLGTLQEQDGELASIRGLMFTFEDIVSVDDRGVQRILKEIDQRDLALSLKAAGSDVAGKIFKNMSDVRRP